MNSRSKGTLHLTIAALCAVFAMVLLTSSQAYAGETILHSFAGGTGDGEYGYGGLVMDSSGNLYGATANGGTHNQGVVYEYSSGGTYSVLWNFGGTGDGQEVYSSLIIDSSGNLYGTTEYGGAHSAGVAFELSPGSPWTETILYSFGAVTHDGQNPYGRLLLDSSGNLYGTTTAGGTGGLGTVFKLSVSGGTWSETKLHDFAGGTTDGNLPYAGLIISGTTLYGTTYNAGANGKGTVYSITTSGGSFTLLYSFAGGTSDGANPYADLAMDSNGNLYGTTLAGGSELSGTAFEITSLGVYSVLWNFGSGTDGYSPYGGFVIDANGNLYGTTSGGGNQGANGTVYELSPSWTETIFYAFMGYSHSDGGSPKCDLVISGSNLYGTTQSGGANNLGTIYKVN